jgi:phosphocarrier protein
MTELEMVVKNKAGLHLRAAATLVKITAQFKAEITIFNGDEQVNAKSIMGIMTLAASQGTKLRVKAEGVDEDLAVTKIKELVDNKFGENE